MNPSRQYLPILSRDATGILDAVLQQDRRLLLFGAPGVGKSTLVSQLAQQLATQHRTCHCLSADPGSPLFGVPGALSLGQWQQGHWQLSAQAALCSLDAGRFRLPLISAAQQLLTIPIDGSLLVDGPGVVRGVSGRELLQGLVRVTRVDGVLVVVPEGSEPPLLDEVQSLAQQLEVFMIPAAAAAKRPGKRARARSRTEQWQQYLAEGVEQTFELDTLNRLGTPPPLDIDTAWSGRQVALLQQGNTLALGEVQQLHENQLTLRLPSRVDTADSLLIRDAMRSENGLIETAEPWLSESVDYLPPADVLPNINRNNGPRLVGRVGGLDVAMVNGVFGDPLLHLHLRHQRRSLLFDLGEGERLPARLAHQVSDVFITHAHADHIAGFIWLLRSRIGEYPPCRLYGPPGLAQHIAGFVSGVLWDRVTVYGPQFEVLEFDGRLLSRYRLHATQPQPQLVEQRRVEQGVLMEEDGYRIRGILLDHMGTEVVAYAFEPDKQINVRKDRLQARGWQPGPWLTELKQQVLNNNLDASIQLPGGDTSDVATLAQQLLFIQPGKKLVYATDFADTPENRQRLVPFARHAHTFFCESSFLQEEVEHALSNGHLTTHACADIANKAGVARLIPFHFSRRYQSQPEKVYEEIAVRCPQLVMPRHKHLFNARSAQLDEASFE